MVAAMSLIGNGNDIAANGNYYLDNELQQFDATAVIEKLNMATLAGLSRGAIKNATGNLHGNFKGNGKFADPRWKGDLNFDTTKFTLTQLGTAFKINSQQIIFDYPAVTVNNFTIRDTLDHLLKIDGSVSVNKVKSLDINLDIDAKDFIILNAPKAINSEFYGYAVADIDIKVTGNTVSPNIEGDIAIKDKKQYHHHHT
ncbi:MAG: translocation/assembly module TamB domain-containing protein [Chitinophagaceae bacterium]|nr:translocation/assembly module TamB domain-containing protein [Chitinophagaceae bacterium]